MPSLAPFAVNERTEWIGDGPLYPGSRCVGI
jgi:hypothetical protein